MLSIKEVTYTDQTLVEDWSRVVTTTTQHDMPGFPPLTPRMAYLWQKHSWPGRRNTHYLAYLEDEPVARLEVSMPTLDNLNNVHFHLEVMPSHRRQGIGRKLYDLVLERAKAEGRGTIVTGSIWELPGIQAHDGGAGPAFAAAMGLESANLPEVMRRLTLSTLDESALAAMFAKAQEKSAGYRIEQWIDRVPDEYIDDIAYLDGRLLADAPTGDLAIEPEKVDADRVRAAEATNSARKRTNFNTGAVHEASGKVVAWTAISTEPEVEWHAWQNITIVDPEHRGHRLGALIKVANLRLALEARPQLKVVDTGNAAENTYMISINEEMGFRPTWALQSWQREL